MKKQKQFFQHPDLYVRQCAQIGVNVKDYIMTESEIKFAELIWEKEPIGSGDLVKLCKETLNWKKSTTYTVLKKLCLQKIFSNNISVITSLITKEGYRQRKSRQFLDENFGGSLPKFLTAFMDRKNLSKKQIEEIRELIDRYEEEN